MQRDFHFSCTGCGKCCDGPPQLSIREMYEHLDDFVLFASIVCQPVKVPNHHPLGPEGVTVTRMTIQRQIDLGSITFDPAVAFGRPGPMMVANLSGLALKSHNRRCPALADDNSCKIYETRPNTCRYVPGQHLLPRGQQDVILRIFKDLHPDDCDWSNEAPLIIKSGEFCDPSMTKAVESAEVDDRADAILFQRLLMDGEEIVLAEYEITISDALEHALTSPDADIPVAAFTLFLDRLRSRGMLPDGYSVPSVGEVARRQRAVCERMIEHNVSTRDISARGATESLRRIANFNRTIELTFG